MGDFGEGELLISPSFSDEALSPLWRADPFRFGGMYVCRSGFEWTKETSLLRGDRSRRRREREEGCCSFSIHRDFDLFRVSCLVFRVRVKISF